MNANAPTKHHYRPDHVLLLNAASGPNTSVHINQHGQLILQAPELAAIAVQPVVAFALSAPRECISLVDGNGKERAFIERLDALPQASQAAIAATLALREFIPEIKAIQSVSSFSTPTVWKVETDRGTTDLHLQSEDDIRKLDVEGKALRITSKDNLQYAIPDIQALPNASRKLLARFI